MLREQLDQSATIQFGPRAKPQGFASEGPRPTNATGGSPLRFRTATPGQGLNTARRAERFQSVNFAGTGFRPVGAPLLALAGGWLGQTGYSKCRQHRGLGRGEAVQLYRPGELVNPDHAQE